MQAMLSILSMYAYDNTIFDDMELPEDVDRQTIIDKICFDNAELSLLYIDPDAMKLLIKNWSTVQCPNWTRIAEALEAEYSPIENYDRHELWTDAGSSSTQDSTTNSTQDSTTGSTQQTTGTTRKVAGWNDDSSLTPSEGVDSTGSGSSTQQSTGSSTQQSTGSGTTSNRREGRTHGNIGVTTAQDMITQEIKLRSSITLADVISSSFRKHFCIMIY